MSATENKTRLGTASLIVALIVVILWCVYFALFAAMTEGGVTFGMDGETAGYTLIFGGGAIMAALTILLTLTGIVLGILALRKKDPKRGLTLAGLALNFLCFLPYCLFFVLLAIGGISTTDFSKFIPALHP